MSILAALRHLCNSARMGAGHNHRNGHHHGHHHGHSHGHGHSQGVQSSAYAVAIGLNLCFVVAETVVGFVSGSMALLADAGHNLSDVLSLLLAWGASRLGTMPPSSRYTYGFKSSTILAALANAALLWVALGAILVETLRRIAEPSPVEGMTMIIVAAIGIAVNGVSALLFARGQKHDLNLRAAFTHLLADAAVSAGVVVAGIAVLLTGAPWIDAVTSLVITAVIGWGSWGLLRDAVRMGLSAVPDGIDHSAVRQFLMQQTGVEAVHDLHIWPMSTTETALTVHLVIPGGYPGDGFLHDLSHALDHDFGIGHATIQIETGEMTDCALSSDAVV